MLNLTNVICPSFKNVTNRAINNLTIVLSSVQSVARFLNFFWRVLSNPERSKNRTVLAWSSHLTWQSASVDKTVHYQDYWEIPLDWKLAPISGGGLHSQYWGGRGGDKAGKQLHFTTTRRVREEDGRSPDTRLEGHLGRRQARDDSLIARHMRLPIEGWTAIKVFVMLWSW